MSVHELLGRCGLTQRFYNSVATQALFLSFDASLWEVR